MIIGTAMVIITSSQSHCLGIDCLKVSIKQAAPAPPLPAAELSVAGLMPRLWALSSPALSTELTA